MITIQIDNPEIEALYSQKEIEEKVNDFFGILKPKKRNMKDAKLILYSTTISDFSPEVQADLQRDDEQLEYIDY